MVKLSLLISGGKITSGPADYTVIDNYLCRTPHPFMLSLGVYRFVTSSTSLRKNEKFYRCNFFPIYEKVNSVVFSIGFLLNVGSLVVLLSSPLRNNRKYGQLIVMNSVGIIDCVAFFYYFIYRFFLTDTPSRFQCILSFQMMGFSFNLLQTVLMSLLIECIVAIYSPFKYRSIVSVKRIVSFNLFFIVCIFLFLVVYPCIVYPAQYGSEIVYCSYGLALPEDFLQLIGIFSAIYFASSIIFCLLIGIGVIQALVRRRALASQKDSKFITQSLALTSRLFVIVIANYVCILPLVATMFGIFSTGMMQDISLVLAFSVCSWNVLIFVFGDESVRRDFKSLITNRRELNRQNAYGTSKIKRHM